MDFGSLNDPVFNKQWKLHSDISANHQEMLPSKLAVNAVEMIKKVFCMMDLVCILDL